MILRGLAGIAVFLLLAWLMSENRRHLPLKMVAAGIGVQLIFGLVLLKVPLCMQLFCC